MNVDSFRYDNQPFGLYLVRIISAILNRTEIPNVLWGDFALKLHGLPFPVEVTDTLL